MGQRKFTGIDNRWAVKGKEQGHSSDMTGQQICFTERLPNILKIVKLSLASHQRLLDLFKQLLLPKSFDIN